MTFSAGHYRDEIAFDAHEPKFRRRLVVFDSHAIGTLLIVFLINPPWHRNP